MTVNKILFDRIEKERSGMDYYHSEEDNLTLARMLEEINSYCGTDIHYLAEIATYDIRGAGAIMAKYLDLYQSETIRGYIIPQLVSDNIADCAEIVLRAYLHFKNSDEYVSKIAKPSPAHIYTRYDNALKKLQPKKLKNELLLLASNPRDAYYLPFTMRMMASWKMPQMENLLYLYMDGNNISAESVGLCMPSQNAFPALSTIRRELRFLAIEGLKHFPSEKSLELVSLCVGDPDADICFAAKKTKKHIERSLVN